MSEIILKCARRIAHYEAIEYAWKIAKKTKTRKAYREALRLILFKISDGSKPDVPNFDIRDLLDQLPVIPDDILKALKS